MLREFLENTNVEVMSIAITDLDLSDSGIHELIELLKIEKCANMKVIN